MSNFERQLPNGWRWGTIEETGHYINGVAFKPADWCDEGLPIIRIQNLTNPDKPLNRTTRQVDPVYRIEIEDLLVSWSATLDAFLWDRETALLNQHIFKVIPNEKVTEKRFLFYLLKQAISEMVKSEHLHGSTMKHINRGPFLAHPVPIPPLDEQIRIVAEIEKQFTRLDAGVAALQRVQAKLKRYRASVLKSACEGRLVPTESELARAEGRGYEPAKVLLQRILTERREKWNGRGKYKEPAAPDIANLPELPEGWVWANIDQLAEVGTGATPKRGTSAFYDGGNIPWITSAALNKPFVNEASEFVTDEALAKTNLTLYESGTLLVAMYGEGKTRGKCSELRIEATTNQAIAAVQCYISVREYVKLSLLRQYEDLRLTASGGVQPNLNLSLVKAITIPLPPLVEQNRIVTEVERRLSVIDELEAMVTANLQRATRLRQSILQQAFNGKLVTKEVPQLKLVDKVSVTKRHANRHFIRAVLSGEIVDQLHDEPTFGRVKHQKILHLCEYIAELEEIEGEYHRKAAGPMDNKLFFANVSEMKKQKWYAEIKIGKRSFYKPLEKAGSQRKYFERYWPDKIRPIEGLLKLMQAWSTETCEIFSTTYAAWNDLLIWGKDATEEAILHEIIDRWDDSKKRIPEKKWRKAISWIERKGFAPVGFGKSTADPE